MQGCVVLAALLVEVAILVSVIGTQRAAKNRLAALVYNTTRTAATASLVANMPLNPSQSTDGLFVWITESV
jgi:hypothetical protein